MIFGNLFQEGLSFFQYDAQFNDARNFLRQEVVVIFWSVRPVVIQFDWADLFLQFLDLKLLAQTFILGRLEMILEFDTTILWAI